jgi:hypothetical protein
MKKVLKIFFLLSYVEYRQICLNILIDNYYLATKLRNKLYIKFQEGEKKNLIFKKKSENVGTGKLEHG